MTSFLDILIATFLGGLGMTLGCLLGLGIAMFISDKFNGFLPWV